MLENYFVAIGVKDSAVRKVLLVSFLSGAALDWVIAVDENAEPSLNYPAAISSLQSRFDFKPDSDFYCRRV